VKYLRSIINTGTAIAGAAAVRYALFWLVLGVILLGLLALGTVIVAAFSKRSAPMSRLRALIRDLRG
jgi:hypothetical protein